MKNILFIILFTVTILFTGCVSIKDQLIKQGYSVGYSEGFADGNSSGQAAGGYIYARFRKDVSRSQRDSRYSQGWQDGFRYGKGRKDSITTMSSRY